MPGHGSPPPEDRGNHPGRQVGSSERVPELHQRLSDEFRAKRAAALAKYGDLGRVGSKPPRRP